MKRINAIGTGVALFGGLMAPCALAATGSAVSGTVRSADGTPQMGMLIELLTPSATLIAQAITDEQGHYLLRIAQAGMYQLRASSAFLSPALQSTLMLRSGADTIANLTLPTAVQPRAVKVSTTPAEHRADDWRWVLRSAANRPLLRWNHDGDLSANPGQLGSEGKGTGPTRRVQELHVTGGSGAFAEGPLRESYVVERLRPESSTRLQASWGEDGQPDPGIALQLQRVHQAGGRSRLSLFAQAHSELVSRGSTGYSMLQSVATETFSLGDLVQVDVGTLLTAERLLNTHVQSSPYLRLGLSPSEDVTLEYSYATDRALQNADDLDAESRQPEVLADASGRPVSHAGSHHELTITRTRPAETVSVAVFRDDLPAMAVQGLGLLSTQDVNGLPVLLDRATDSFRVTSTGLQTVGMHAGWSGALRSGASARVEAAFGRVLREPEAAESLHSAAAQVRSGEAGMIRASLRLANAKAGSSVEASYRWQPHGSLSQVDAFEAEPNDACLSLGLEQRLWSGSHAERMKAVVQVSNLLAEGYIPFLSSDGNTAYLAQVPRTVEARLVFRF